MDAVAASTAAVFFLCGESDVEMKSGDGQTLRASKYSSYCTAARSLFWFDL